MTINLLESWIESWILSCLKHNGLELDFLSHKRGTNSRFIKPCILFYRLKMVPWGHQVSSNWLSSFLKLFFKRAVSWALSASVLLTLDTLVDFSFWSLTVNFLADKHWVVCVNLCWVANITNMLWHMFCVWICLIMLTGIITHVSTHLSETKSLILHIETVEMLL